MTAQVFQPRWSEGSFMLNIRSRRARRIKARDRKKQKWNVGGENVCVHVLWRGKIRETYSQVTEDMVSDIQNIVFLPLSQASQLTNVSLTVYTSWLELSDSLPRRMAWLTHLTKWSNRRNRNTQALYRHTNLQKYLNNSTCYNKIVCTVMFSSRLRVYWYKLFGFLKHTAKMAKFW